MHIHEPDPDWVGARRRIQAWLAETATRPITLAQQAGIHRSILSRFLAGRPLDTGSAMKLFAVVQRSMGPPDRIALLENMGLLPLALLLRDSLREDTATTAPSRSASLDGPARAERLMAQADAAATRTVNRSWSDALALYLQAEEAFGRHHPGAPRAAIQAAQMLLNLGHFDRVEAEIARLRARYNGMLDEDLEYYATSLSAWLYFGRRDLEPAAQWFTRLVENAQQAGTPTHEASNLQFLGYIHVLHGQSMSDGAAASAWYHLAERCLEHSLTLHATHDPDEQSQAWSYLRLGQLRICTGSHCEAQKALRRAHHLLAHNPAVTHVELAEAELRLKEGESRAARRLAEDALQVQAMTGYAQGMARATRILSLACLEENRPLEALEYGAAAVLFNPHISREDPPPLADLLRELSQDHRREIGGRMHSLWLESLRERALERRGIFAHLSVVTAMSDDRLDQLHAVLSGSGMSEG